MAELPIQAQSKIHPRIGDSISGCRQRALVPRSNVPTRRDPPHGLVLVRRAVFVSRLLACFHWRFGRPGTPYASPPNHGTFCSPITLFPRDFTGPARANPGEGLPTPLHPLSRIIAPVWCRMAEVAHVRLLLTGNWRAFARFGLAVVAVVLSAADAAAAGRFHRQELH